MVGVKGTFQETDEIRILIGKMLARIDLELSPSKTKITNTNLDKALFLGTEIMRAKEYTYTRPSHNHYLKRNSRKLRFLAPISRIEKILSDAGFMKNGKSYPKFV